MASDQLLKGVLQVESGGPTAEPFGIYPIQGGAPYPPLFGPGGFLERCTGLCGSDARLLPEWVRNIDPDPDPDGDPDFDIEHCRPGPDPDPDRALQVDRQHAQRGQADAAGAGGPVAFGNGRHAQDSERTVAERPLLRLWYFAGRERRCIGDEAALHAAFDYFRSV